MGTWGTEILGNDTSCEVYEEFIELYNLGQEGNDISKNLLDRLAENLEDKEEHNDILFALALAQWQTASLDNDFLNKIKHIIETGADITLWQELGVDQIMLASRKKELNSFLKKISIPKSKAKARKKPPTLIETDYINGTCLAFQFPDKSFGGVVIIDAEFYNSQGSLPISLTTICQNKLPTIEDFQNSTFLNCKWYTSEDSITRKKYKIAGIQQHLLEYQKSKQRKPFFEFIQSYFTIVGNLPKFEKGYHSTTWISIDYSNETNAIPVGFGAKLSKQLDYLFTDKPYKSSKKDKVQLIKFPKLTKK